MEEFEVTHPDKEPSLDAEGTTSEAEDCFLHDNGLVSNPPVIDTAPVLTPPPIPVAENAGFWKRVVALCIELPILLITGVIGAGLSGGILGGIMGAAGADITYIGEVCTTLGKVYWIPFLWLYFTLFESSSWQATPGKKALGLVVKDVHGKRISFIRANARYWGKFLSMGTLFIGFIMAGFTKNKQALHDIVAGCLVTNKFPDHALSVPRNETQKDVWDPWSTAIFGVLIFLAFVITQTIIMFTFMAVNVMMDIEFDAEHYITTIESNGQFLSIATCTTAIVCISMIVLVIKRRKGPGLKEYLALYPISMRMCLTLTAIALGFILLQDSLTFLLGQPIVPQFMIDVYTTQTTPILLWIALVIGAPLFEEFFFRGFLFEGLKTAWFGEAGTIVLTSFLWTIIHLQYGLYALATIFVLGVILGTVRLKSGSLWGCVLMHGIQNLVATIETVYYVHNFPT